jgi:hypothetical protein
MLIGATPNAAFNLILEACYAEQFYNFLSEAPELANLGNVATSTGDAAVSVGSRSGSPFVTWIIRGFERAYSGRRNRDRAPTTLSGAIRAAWLYQRAHNPRVRLGQESFFHPHRARLSAPVPTRCTGYGAPQGCLVFLGAVVSGGMGMDVASGTLQIETGSAGYCASNPCELRNRSVQYHLDTSFPRGARVTAVATPSPGSRFAHWSQGACSGQGPTCSFTATKDSCIYAQFVVDKDPGGGASPAPPARCSQDPTGP